MPMEKRIYVRVFSASEYAEIDTKEPELRTKIVKTTKIADGPPELISLTIEEEVEVTEEELAQRRERELGMKKRNSAYDKWVSSGGRPEAVTTKAMEQEEQKKITGSGRNLLRKASAIGRGIIRGLFE